MKRIKTDNTARNQRIGAAAVILAGGSLITAIAMTPSDRDRVEPAIAFLTSEVAQDPLNLVGYGDTFAIRLPEPIVETGHRTSRVHAFNCNRTISEASVAELDAMQGFYAACAEAREIVMAPISRQSVTATYGITENMLMDTEGRVMRTDGTRVCAVVNGEPFPFSGQPVPDFLRHKAACAAYLQSPKI